MPQVQIARGLPQTGTQICFRCGEYPDNSPAVGVCRACLYALGHHVKANGLDPSWLFKALGYKEQWESE